MCDEEVRAACQDGWVRVLVQILCDHLKYSELLRGKGQLQSFGDITRLQWRKWPKTKHTAVTKHITLIFFTNQHLFRMNK